MTYCFLHRSSSDLDNKIIQFRMTDDTVFSQRSPCFLFLVDFPVQAYVHANTPGCGDEDVSFKKRKTAMWLLYDHTEVF